MKTKMMFFVCFIVSTCLFSTIINVPTDQPTIQDGINAGADTDTVLVEEGTYFENIDFIGKAITVASNFIIDGEESHIENTIINGSQPEDPDFGSCVSFSSGENNNSVITGFTITEGTGTLNPTWNATFGGGIYCEGSSPKIISNTITGNSADGTGGIECIDVSIPIIMYNEISFNSTLMYEAGGIDCWNNSDAYIEGNEIINNHSAHSAGGINVFQSSPTIINNIISGNSSDLQVGGVTIQEASATLRNNIICNNVATTDIAGLCIAFGSEVTVVQNCLIYGNIAGGLSGGVLVQEAEAEITNCVISGNSATSGGGICMFDGSLDLVNSIIEGNDGCGIYFEQMGNVDIQYCDFFNNGTDFTGNVPTGLGDITDENNNGDPCDVFMNIFLDPLFVDPANDDFHLTEFSPCIDAGDDEFPLDPDGTYIEIGRYYFEQVGIDDNIIVHTKDYLHQNYPNPFNPTTTINYQLPENSMVELAVYNLKGQKVKTLVKENLESGNHTVIWNGKDDNGKSVSSGIYFYKMKAGNFVETKKMILMK